MKLGRLKMTYRDPEWAKEEKVAMTISLSEAERVRAMTMTTNALDFLIADAFLADRKSADETNARFLARRDEAEAKARLDVEFALELADRLGEETLREAVEQYAPTNVRSAVDALMSREGGMLPLVQSRIREIEPDAAASNPTACALAAICVLGGVLVDSVLGGIGAVIGIVVMSQTC
jgi:hypothetical protein